MNKYFVIKRADGTYYSHRGSSGSNAPAVFTSRGKAEGRLKQLYGGGMEVVMWDVREERLSQIKENV